MRAAAVYTGWLRAAALCTPHGTHQPSAHSAGPRAQEATRASSFWKVRKLFCGSKTREALIPPFLHSLAQYFLGQLCRGLLSDTGAPKRLGKAQMPRHRARRGGKRLGPRGGGAMPSWGFPELLIPGSPRKGPADAHLRCGMEQ